MSSGNAKHGVSATDPEDGRPHPVNILIVITVMDPGGAENYIMNVIRTIDRERFRVTIVCTGRMSSWYEEELAQLGIPMLFCPNPYTQIGYARRVKRIMETRRFHVVCDFRSDFAAPTLWAARRCDVRNRIAMYRSAGRGFPPGLLRDVYAAAMRRCTRRWATQFIGNTQAVLDAHHPDWRRDPRCAIVHNGVDTRRFSPDVSGVAVRTELGIPEDRLVIGHVGRFHPAKNHGMLLKSFAALQPRVADTHLLLVGDGDLRAQLEREIKANGLEAKVSLAGQRRDVPECLAAMDLFCFPSVYEGLPNALLEAMASGLPFVASRIPSNEEIIPPALDAHLVDKDDCPNLTDQLEALCRAPGQRRRAGDIARQWVTENFSIEASATRLCRHWLTGLDESATVPTRINH